MSKVLKQRVVEIVGPAGSGKTTLYQAFEHYSESIRLENFPDVNKVADAPFFIVHGLRLIPNLLRSYRFNSRQLTRREFAWMTILNGWSALLRKQSNDNGKIIILDQGPVYLLAEMRLFGPEYLMQKAAESLWQDLYSSWAATLDMIIWLDAADEILLNRIQNREQELIVKNHPAKVVYEYLNRYRTEYDCILSTLATRNADLKVLQIDTGRQSTQNIVNQFLSEITC